MLDQAHKIAKRSTIRTHKTGAVIVRPDLTIVSNGWSHVPHYKLKSKRSLHAEIHALARGRYYYLSGCYCYIVTIVGKSGNTTSAKPCLDCAIALQAAGIYGVFYSTTNDQSGYLSLLPPGLEDVFADLKIYRKGE